MVSRVKDLILRGKSPFSLSFVSHANDAGGSAAVTYSALSFGNPDKNRIILVCTSGRANATSALINSVTVAGIPATQVPGAVADSGGTGLWVTDMWQANVPAGASGNVVVTYANTTARSAVQLYRLVTNNKVRHAATSTFNASTASPITSSAIDVPSGGVGIAIFGCRGPGVSNPINWTNVTSDFSDLQYATAATQGVASTFVAGSLTVTAGISGQSTTANCLSVVSWAP